MTYKLPPLAAIALCCGLLSASPGTMAAAGEPQPVPQTEQLPMPLPAQTLTPDTLFLLLLGEIAGGRGELNTSVEAYLLAARQTRDPRIAQRATEIALYARELDAATSAARIWLDSAPQSDEARRMLASILATRGGQLNEVQIELARILATSEGKRLEQNLLGLNRALAPLPDKSLAHEVIVRLTEPYDEHPAAWLARAQATAADSDPIGALLAVDQAIVHRPGWEPAIVFKAQLLAQTEQLEAALDLLSAHLKEHPEHQAARLTHARALVTAGDLSSALVEFRELLKLHPDDADLMYAVALISSEMGDYDLAAVQFERALEVGHPEADAITFNLGRIYEQRGENGEALDWYYRVGEGPHHVDARIRIAHVLASTGALSAARAHLRETANNADAADIRRLVLAEALLLREEGMEDEALERVENVLAQNPEDPDLLYEAAMLAEQLERLDWMEQRLRQLIELEPDHAHAYNALGYALADRGVRLDEAEELIAYALELAPQDPFILDSMGWVRFRRNDPEGALPHLEQAYDQRQDAEIAAHLGEVLWALNRHDDANQIWNEALQNAPDNSTLGETVKRLRGQ